MLTRLEIHNVALIEQALIEPGAGLNIITGETGAGKSILIDALGSLSGNRADRELIRSGRDTATMDAVFRLPEDPGFLDVFRPMMDTYGLEGPDCVLSREIVSAGRSTARLNGRIVPVGALRDVAELLLDIHGQYDNQVIFRTESHIGLLDRFAGAPMQRALDQYREKYRDFQECDRAIRRHSGGDPLERARRIDTMRYQLEEIRDADPKDGEDEELTRRRRVALDASRITESLQKADVLLSGDEEVQADALLAMAEGALEDAADRFSETQSALDAVREARILVEDAASSVRDLLEQMDTDPAELERMEERLDQLHRLRRKYGPLLSDVLTFADRIERELEEEEEGSHRLEQLLRRRDLLAAELADQADALHDLREAAARELSARICSELEFLDMQAVRFEARIDELPEHTLPGRRGRDDVAFLLSPNPGEPLRPLARIASGGEASRIMLAIKTILAEADHTPVLVFDEIDTGVSGHTAARVGERLSHIAERHQVFCVTHLPQIAAMADQHLLIEKTTDGQVTRTGLRMLDEDRRREELARLLSGGTGRREALELAGHLREEAERFKATARKAT